MQNKLKRLIRIAYRSWRKQQEGQEEPHPDEEELACFLEDRLSFKEKLRIQEHLIRCERCAEALAANLKLENVIAENIVPAQLVEKVKQLIEGNDQPILEIYLKLKEKVLEIVSTTGDILVGREFLPAPVLRSRKIKDFKDEVTILKDFKEIRVELKIENKGGQAFDLTVIVKEKETQKIIKDLRVTLLKENVELESYLNDSGRVVFENVLLGRYTVEILTIDTQLAAVLIDIKT